MTSVFNLFKKHPLAIIFWLLYTLLCIHLLILSLHFDDQDKTNSGLSRIALGGEGAMLSDIFLVIVGGIFFVVNCGYAIDSRKERKFYLCLMLFILVETVAVFAARGYLS